MIGHSNTPRLLSPKRIRDAKLAQLCAAAIEYADATENNGDPLAAGARLRLAAKAYAVAARYAGEVP
jgi:hypothetical protein